MVSKQGPAITGGYLSLAFHIAIWECLCDDVAYVMCLCVNVVMV